MTHPYIKNGAPDVRDPEQRPAAFAGLSERLRRQAAERDRLLLPVLRVPQVADKKVCEHCGGDTGYWVTAGKLGDPVGRRRWVKCERCQKAAA